MTDELPNNVIIITKNKSVIKEQKEKIVTKYEFSKNGTELFSLQAIVNKNNKLCLFNNSNYDGCIPTQFIVTTKSTEYLIEDYTSIDEYYNKANIDFGNLKSVIDQEFVAHILAAKEFDEKIISENGGVGKGELDLGLDEALVYAYIFAHTYREIHEQIRLFDWENINKGELGFLKDSLQPDKITETLNIKLGEEVYLPMIVHKEKISKNLNQNKYNHISFITVKSKYIYKTITDNNDYCGKQSKELIEREEFVIKSFDTLGQNSGNEQYIKSQQTGTQTKQKSKKQTEPSPQIVLKTQITTAKQGASGCGFLTALKAVNYINKYSVDLSITGKNIEETKKTLIKGFGYKIDENAIDKDGSIKSYPITIYYKDGRKAFEITKDIIEAIQQENKEVTQHGTPPIEHKTITESYSPFANMEASSTSTDNLDYKQHQTLITPTPPQKDNTPSQPFQ